MPTRHITMQWIRRCALLVLSAWASGAWAQAACGPYKVAYYEFGSFYFKNETGQFVGIDKDVLTELAQRSGCVLEGFLDSRTRIWAHMAEGSLDMTTSGIATPVRKQFAHFLPYIQSRNYLITKKGPAPESASLAAFTANKKLRVAIVKSFGHGAAADAWIAQLRAEHRVDEYADVEVVSKVFALGRADAFLAEPVNWTPLLQHNALEGKVRMHDWFARDQFPMGLVLSKTRVRGEDVDLMRKTIQTMHDDGTLLAIYRRYMPADIAKRAASEVLR